MNFNEHIVRMKSSAFMTFLLFKLFQPCSWMMLFIFKGFEELKDVLVVQMLFMLHKYEPLFANCKKNYFK